VQTRTAPRLWQKRLHLRIDLLDAFAERVEIGVKIEVAATKEIGDRSKRCRLG
jgi:hypothetical protein